MVTTQLAGKAAANQDALDAALSELYDAWRDRDSDRIKALFSDRDDLVLWGSDKFERIVGRAEADRNFGSWIAACPPWTAMKPFHRVSEVRGDFAWVADEVNGTWVDGPSSGVDTYRVTTVWSFNDDRWQVIHANISIPN